MKINMYNFTKTYSGQSRINEYIQNKINQKEKNDADIINKGLEEMSDGTNTATDTASDVSFITSYISYLYSPVTDTLKSLSLNKSIYDKDTEELKSNDLSEEDRSKIQDEMNSAKDNIMKLTSPEYISNLNNHIANDINPIVNKLVTRLNNKIGTNLDTSSFTIKSMGNLGFSSNMDTDFNNILQKITNATNSMREKNLSLYDIAGKYGASPNKDLIKLLDIQA